MDIKNIGLHISQNNWVEIVIETQGSLFFTYTMLLGMTYYKQEEISDYIQRSEMSMTYKVRSSATALNVEIG